MRGTLHFGNSAKIDAKFKLMMSNTITISLVIIFGIALIGWLVWKNKKDEQLLNPDNQEAVEETMMTQANSKDRI